MQYLDFSALEQNARYFKGILGKAKLCAVVKNNAYGHGIAHIARYLDDKVDFFAVGSADEAKQIDFVHRDILILLPQDKDGIRAAMLGGYVLSLDSLQSLQAIAYTADKLDMQARVHIKIDSGMSRLGFRPDEINQMLKMLQCKPQIAAEGVYSHFYGENTHACDKQYRTFLPCAEALEKALNRSLIKHISNSRGALLSAKYHLDMSRVGLGLYGYGNENLVPVKTVTARILAVKEVCAGDIVGYGASFVAPCDGRIAVLDVGYAQGFGRALVGASVSVKGVKCKVVAVCMAMIMVDIPDNLNVYINDIVTLLGSGTDISNDIVSVYELLCNLK